MTFAYHFTHIDNLDSILKHGLLATSEKARKDINHENIANMDIQNTRSKIAINSEFKLVEKNLFSEYLFDYHEFVPFYFSKRSPMLLSLSMQKNIDQERIIYFVINCEKFLEEKICFFTDESANRLLDLPNISKNADDFDLLNWDAIRTKRFKLDDDTKHAKMAEFLVHKKISISEIVGIVTYPNKVWPKEVRKIFEQNQIESPKIVMSEHFYYLNSRPVYTAEDEQWQYPCVIGPQTLFEETLKSIEQTIKIRSKRNQQYKFTDVYNLLANLEKNPNCIRELAETNNLFMRYGGYHNSTVGAHSKRVFDNLEDIKEYGYLIERDRVLVKISAFIHDIGKGPRSRWNGGRMHEADPNHSLKSLPILKRILSQEIGELTEDDIYKIFICVTYDDLVGEIIGKGRNKKQLFDLIKSRDILDLLFTLGKADLKDVNSSWLDDESSFNALYIEALQEINE